MKIRTLFEAGRGPIAGFTLVEMLVASGIMGMMLVSLYAAFVYGFGVVGQVRDDLRATQILMQKTEALRLCRWTSLSNCPISFVTSYDPSATGGAGGNNRGTIYWGTITTNAASSIPDDADYKSKMRLVTVSVSWTNYISGKPVVRTRQMQTQTAEFGLQNYVWGPQ